MLCKQSSIVETMSSVRSRALHNSGFFMRTMFFSKIDREEFEILKKDLFFFSGQLGQLTKRIEELERNGANYEKIIVCQYERIKKLEAKKGRKK